MNSSTTITSVVQDAKRHPDLAPVVQGAVGGSSLEPALTIANNVMIELISQVFNWKWNRFVLPYFYTNSFQQDYALNVINLGWLEQGVLLDVNNTSTPQPKWPLECVKDLPETSYQYGMPGQVSWLPNNQLNYATWGASNPANGNATGTWPNPQPLQTITGPIGVSAMPNNPLTQVADAYGNYWVITGYGASGQINGSGVTGASNPFATNLNPVYPTSNSPSTTATVVTDGTIYWTAVNPSGMGVRCNPLPPQTGVIYQFRIVGQYRAFAFSSGPFTQFSQTIEPIPDDFASYFRAGFVAMAYSYSPDAKVRGKFQDMYNIWKESLFQARRQGDRERDNQGFYAANSLMQQPFQIYPGPAYPWPLP